MTEPQFETYRERRTPARVVRPLRYRWRLRAGNGEIVATGEAYTREEDAERGARDVVELIAVTDRLPIVSVPR